MIEQMFYDEYMKRLKKLQKKETLAPEDKWFIDATTVILPKDKKFVKFELGGEWYPVYFIHPVKEEKSSGFDVKKYLEVDDDFYEAVRNLEKLIELISKYSYEQNIVKLKDIFKKIKADKWELNNGC